MNFLMTPDNRIREHYRKQLAMSKYIKELFDAKEQERRIDEMMEAEKKQLEKGFDAEEIETPSHYDNSKGSLYKFAEDQGLNSYEFDILKRLVRCRRKGQFIEDIDKTIAVLELYKKEFEIK